jgi:iron complex outermembrane receptor protein
MKISHALFGFLLLAHFALSAQITIVGKITDAASKEALVGATVLIGGRGTTSDTEGVYRLELSKAGEYQAIIRLVGYENGQKNIKITEGGNPEFNFELTEVISLLQTATVTAGKFEKPLAEVTVSMDVLKPQLLENVNTRSVSDVLQKVPGVNIIDGQANIRGGSGWSYGAGSRVLLLVDDIPALQADAGFPNWKDVAVENVEQIEVVKGAASALYGSSAMNGIINVRTGFAKSEPETKVATYYNAYLSPKDPVKHWWKGVEQPSDFGISLSHKQKFGKFDFVGTVFYNATNSYQKDWYDRYGRVSVSTRYRLTDRLSIGLNANVNRGSNNTFFYFANHTDSTYIGARGTYGGGTRTRFWLDPYLNYFDGKGNRHKILGRFYSVTNDVQSQTDQSNASNLFYGEYQFQRQFPKDLVLTTGIVAGGTAIEAALYGNSRYTSVNTAAYLQLDKKIGKLNLSFGGRYERNTIYGPDSVRYNAAFTEAVPNMGDLKEAKPVFRVGANYQIGKASFLRTSWGQGYRFPTVAEMFINTRAGALVIFPAPRLTSETGWTGEVGLKQGFKIGDWQGFADASVFWSEYSNMMEFIFSDTLFIRTREFGFRSENVGNTRIKGFELSVQGQTRLGNFTPSVLLGYTYIDPRFRNFEPRRDTASLSVGYNVLKYRFRHNFKLDAELAHRKFLVGVAILYNSNMEAIDRILETNDPLFRLILGTAAQSFASIRAFRRQNDNGFMTLDIRAAYFFTPKLKLSLIGANLTNTEYAYRPGLVEAPRNVQFRLDYKF